MMFVHDPATSKGGAAVEGGEALALTDGRGFAAAADRLARMESCARLTLRARLTPRKWLTLHARLTLHAPRLQDGYAPAGEALQTLQP
ncbi:hypothetical protein T492DRAFT_892529 [Pavlovales sp. CCMP2436]|nr:hypothetical protein T492DRAFT_892529 [Pavlovales sp. CCMP2436]